MKTQLYAVLFGVILCVGVTPVFAEQTEDEKAAYKNINTKASLNTVSVTSMDYSNVYLYQFEGSQPVKQVDMPKTIQIPLLIQPDVVIEKYNYKFTPLIKAQPVKDATYQFFMPTCENAKLLHIELNTDVRKAALINANNTNNNTVHGEYAATFLEIAQIQMNKILVILSVCD